MKMEILLKILDSLCKCDISTLEGAVPRKLDIITLLFSIVSIYWQNIDEQRLIRLYESMMDN